MLGAEPVAAILRLLLLKTISVLEDGDSSVQRVLRALLGPCLAFGSIGEVSLQIHWLLLFTPNIWLASLPLQPPFWVDAPMLYLCGLVLPPSLFPL